MDDELNYISVGPTRRIEGVWMPRERYESLTRRVEELERENEQLRGHFEVEGDGLRCNVCGRHDPFNEL